MGNGCAGGRPARAARVVPLTFPDPEVESYFASGHRLHGWIAVTWPTTSIKFECRANRPITGDALRLLWRLSSSLKIIQEEEKVFQLSEDESNCEKKHHKNRAATS